MHKNTYIYLYAKNIKNNALIAINKKISNNLSIINLFIHLFIYLDVF